MSNGFIQTPCLLVFYNGREGKLELSSRVDTDKCHLVLGIVCQGVIFALNDFSKRSLIGFQSSDSHLAKILPNDNPKAVETMHNILLQKTITMLSFHCNVDTHVVKKPLLLWKE